MADCDVPGKRRFICDASDVFFEKLAAAISGATPIAYAEDFEHVTGTELVVTAHEGILPVRNEQIILSWAYGPVPRTGWSVDRDVEPNKIILNETAEDEFFSLWFLV